ncbi:MAG: hypothetical protein FLDDKLPJ_03667 [Phycisphaerae bacterium]|nr:hypothetical protein [Phycisphaerae bacterium]
MLVMRTKEGIEFAPFRLAEHDEQRARLVELGCRLVIRYLRKMAGSEGWSRKHKKRAAALAIAAIVSEPDELRAFVNATFSERDGAFVDVWVARYLRACRGIKVSNVTVAAILDQLEATVETLMEKSRNHAH